MHSLQRKWYWKYILSGIIVLQERTKTVVMFDFYKYLRTDYHVTHGKLINKLNNYWVKGNTLSWIEFFLNNRTQTVVIDGKQSRTAPVMPCVPQGTVLGPVLLLNHINDLPDNITSQGRLFADHTKVYVAISKIDCSETLTHSKLGRASEIEFNPRMCQVLQITRARKPITDSVTRMFGELSLHSLALRRADARRIMLFKIPQIQTTLQCDICLMQLSSG